MEYNCQYCDSKFKNQYTLKSHINGSKKCLKNRGLELETTILCDGCKLSYSNRHNLYVHQKSCKEYIILMIKEENDKVVFALKEELEKQKKYIEELKFEYKEQIDKLQNTIQTLAKEAINRPTTINNIRTNLSNIYTIDQMKTDELLDLFKENLTEQVFMSGQKGLAKLCTEKIINTKDSKKLICCTDISRKKFKCMDKNGNLIDDVEARQFVDKVTKPIKEVGRQVYDTMMYSINEERDQAREDEYGKKDRLINQSFQVMDRYKDIINLDDPKYNNEFTSELAILNKNLL